MMHAPLPPPAALPLLALAAEPAGGRLAQVLAAREVRVCIWPDYFGITFRNPKTLALSGIDIDLARQFARDLDVAVQFVDSSFARLVGDLVQERCDVAMFGIGITPARQQRLRFTQRTASDICYRQEQPPHQPLGRHRSARCRGGGQGLLHEAVMKDRRRG
jgi:ABC-type amino acid transport substrate-binding protein